MNKLVPDEVVREWAEKYRLNLFEARTVAALAAAYQAEKCAQVCDGNAWAHPNARLLGPEMNATKCAADIRAMIPKEGV